MLGALGRMGREIIRLSGELDDIDMVAAVDRNEGTVGGILVGTDTGAALAGADVYIDFSAPAATRSAATLAAEHQVAAIIGTTGLGPEDEAALATLAERAPVLVAANFSLGVNLMLVLAEQAARALPGFDLEVVELHHRRKRDAPSGTAISVGKALAAGRGVAYDEAHLYAREGDVGPRTDDEIGIVAVRGGGIIGEHTAYLIGEEERVEITHRAASRSIFARGALRAAQWIAGKAPGRYSMRDVLGL
jgi:4-hydroxy-tetrahydrodipicolinate reductase